MSARNLAEAWDEGYYRGVRDEAGEVEKADNPYGVVCGVLHAHNDHETVGGRCPGRPPSAETVQHDARRNQDMLARVNDLVLASTGADRVGYWECVTWTVSDWWKFHADLLAILADDGVSR